MAIEIEKKFLVSHSLEEQPVPPMALIHTTLRSMGIGIARQTYIHQDYLKIERSQAGEMLEEERVRRAYPIMGDCRDEAFYHTVKIGQGELRREEERQIRRSEYDALIQRGTVGTQIVKIRHCVPIGNHVLEIDAYLGLLKGLRICEIEFPDLETSRNFMPDAIEWLLGEEVTHKPTYSNANLALSGKVPENN